MKIKALLLSLAIIANTMPSANTNTEEKRCYFNNKENNWISSLNIPESLYKKVQTKCGEPFPAIIRDKGERDRLNRCLNALNIDEDYYIIATTKEDDKGDLIADFTVMPTLSSKFKSNIKFLYPIKFDEIITQRISPCLEQYKNKNLTDKLDTDKLDNEFVTCIVNSLKGTNFVLDKEKSKFNKKSIMNFLIEETPFNPEEEHILL